MDNTQFTDTAPKTEPLGGEEATKAPEEAPKTDNVLPNDDVFKEYVDKKLQPILEENEQTIQQLKEQVQNTIDELVATYQRDMANLRIKPETPQEKEAREYKENYYEGTYFKKL